MVAIAAASGAMPLFRVTSGHMQCVACKPPGGLNALLGIRSCAQPNQERSLAGVLIPMLVPLVQVGARVDGFVTLRGCIAICSGVGSGGLFGVHVAVGHPVACIAGMLGR